jgi:hypothetical protein
LSSDLNFVSRLDKEKQKVWKSLSKLETKFKSEDKIPLLDPYNDMKIENKKYKKYDKKTKIKVKDNFN